jgi:hypothetical protein
MILNLELLIKIRNLNRHHITEIVLKVALSAITITHPPLELDFYVKKVFKFYKHDQITTAGRSLTDR